MNTQAQEELKRISSLLFKDADEGDLRNYYPEDKGLLYVQSYMQIFDPASSPIAVDNLNHIIGFGKFRTDAPAFLRKLVGTYLDSIGHKQPATEERDFNAHGILLQRVEAFKARFPEKYNLANRIIYEHYEKELAGKKVNRLTHTKAESEKNARTIEEIEKDESHIKWYDRVSLRSHLDNVERSQRGIILKALAQPERKPKIQIADESIFDSLDSDFPNFKAVTRFYKAQFRLAEETEKYRINPIIFVGSAGIGKTLYAKRLATVLNTRLEYIDMSAISGGWILNGNNPSWHNAKAGRIAEAVINCQTVNPIVVLDEIEKSSEGKYDPLAPLYTLLEENTAKEFIDEFIEQPINASGVIYIACANTLDGIPEPVLTRMKVFNIPDPSREDKEKIYQNIYEQCTEKAPLFNPVLSKSLIEELIDKSLREAKQFLNDAVANALLEYSKEELRIMKQRGEVINVELKHLNIHRQEKAKFGF